MKNAITIFALTILMAAAGCASKEIDEIRIVEKIECERDALNALQDSHRMMVAAAEIFADLTISNENAFKRALKLQYAVDRNLTKVLTYYYNDNASARDCRVIYGIADAQGMLTTRTKEIAEHWNSLNEEEASQPDQIALFQSLRTNRCERQKALADLLEGINDLINKGIGDE